jgi:hypothetical protein
MSTYDSASVLYDATTTTYDGAGTQLAIPYLVVEIAFDDGPYVASPTWTDVSSYVRAASTRRGRNDDLATFTGTASLTLSNRDRRFDPFYTSGPYYGKLLPRRQIRVRAIVGANTYPVFRGYIAGWPVTYTDAGKDSTVTIECFDALSLLSVDSTPSSMTEDQITALSPVRWYKLNESVGATTTVTDTAAQLPIVPVSTNPGFTKDGASVGAQGDLALDLWYYNAYTAPPYRPVPDDYTSSSFTLVGWMKALSGTSGTQGRVDYTYGGLQVILYISQTGVQARVRNLTSNTATLNAITTTTGDTTSDFRHIGVSYSGGGGVGGSGVNAYVVDGVVTSGPARTNEIAVTNSGENLEVFQTALSNLAIFTPALTTAQIQDLYYRGLNIINETTSARFQRLIGYTSFPTALTSYPGSPSGSVGMINPDNEISSELKLCSDSEGGELYVDRAGVLTMTARNSQNTATRSVNTQAVFKDTGTDLKYGTSLTIQYDLDSVKNDFTYQFSNGTTTVRNATSISSYGTNTATVSTQLTSPTDANTLANLKLSYFDDPVPAVSPLLVSVTRAAADWQDLLDLELLDQITVTRTPSTGNAVEVRMLVNAVQHDITPGDWNMTVTGSARYSNWFTVDTDFIDGDRLIV